MKISRHIHYFEEQENCLRYEFTFDPPQDCESNIGKIDDIYPIEILSGEGSSFQRTKTAKVINKNGLLHIREVMNAGEALSIELLPGLRLDKMTIGDSTSLQLYASRTGLMYMVTAGKQGTVEVTARVIKDDDGFYRDLKKSLLDTGIRAYLVRQTLADFEDLIKKAKELPKYLSHEQAAEILGLATTTLYNISHDDIPRKKHNRYCVGDLDRHMEKKKKTKKSRK